MATVPPSSSPSAPPPAPPAPVARTHTHTRPAAAGGGLAPAALAAARAGLHAAPPPTSAATGAAPPALVTEADIAALHKRVLDVNAEFWLPILSAPPALTFITRLVPLDPTDAELLVEAWDLRCDLELARARRAAGGFVSGDAAGVAALEARVPAVRARLAALAARLQPVLDEMVPAGSGGAVFAKTSSRSAKDAPATRPAAMRRAVRRALRARLAEEKASSPSLNTRFFALLQAGTAMLAMRSGAAVVASFVRSRRIKDDMEMALDARAESGRFCEHVVLRRWVGIAVDMEFRAFVCGGRLTAISQYNHLLYSARLAADAPAIADRLIAFWTDEVHPRLAPLFEDYVVDFALCGPAYEDAAVKFVPAEHAQGGRIVGDGDAAVVVWVIELNPFESTTDGALFTWASERALLCGAADACAAAQPPPGVGAMVRPGGVVFRWRVRFDPAQRANISHDWRALLETGGEGDPGAGEEEEEEDDDDGDDLDHGLF